MKHLFKQLYDSEINLQFSWFWDTGFDIKIGDIMNGFSTEFNSYDLDECEQWIIDTVIELYPNSLFTKTYLGESFESSTEIVMKYLSENHHPHTMIEITSNSAILYEGQRTYFNDNFILD